MKWMAAALLVVAASVAFAAPKKIGGIQDETGNVKITSIGKFNIAEPMVVVLAPSKETVPDTNAVYAVECKIVYHDKVNPPPTTRRGFKRYGPTCDFLNYCLQGFVSQEYSGWDFVALVEEYRSGSFANRLQGKAFSDYIAKCAEQYKASNPKFRFGVEINAVSVQAISDFAKILLAEPEEPMPAAEQETASATMGQ